MEIKIAQSDTEILACFLVIVQLRQNLSETEFIDRVHRQQSQGYRLVYLQQNGTIKAVAGFRIMETLFCRKLMYVDDLITNAQERSRGHGSKLLQWLAAHAETEKCSSLQLDSAVHRKEAHRFYYKNYMHITEFHFELEVKNTEKGG